MDQEASVTLNDYLLALSEEPGPNAAPELPAGKVVTTPEPAQYPVAAPDYSLSCEVP